MNEHIVKSYDEELETARSLIARMLGMAEVSLSESMKALTDRDSDLAQKVRDADKQLDSLEHEAEELAVSIIALRAPVAFDLRDTVAVLKIAGMVERMGDYAKNIAKRTQVLIDLEYDRTPRCLMAMEKEAIAMIQKVVRSYIDRDVDLAVEVWQQDEGLDNLHNAAYREVLAAMIEEPENINALSHFLMIAKNLERIGDQATNVAEIVYYQGTGEQLDMRRPKNDVTSTEDL